MDFTPCKSYNELEITRNPFDSKDFDKENCPAFSPSIFAISNGNKSSEKKNKDFRWSIDQLAMLQPAKIEEFPYQEYSASYERAEDEVAAQEAINEYFAKVTLPSPWAQSKEHAFKRVTFSPHPPTYYKEASIESGSSMSSSRSSQNEDSKKMVDGSCQTMLTVPPNYDLKELLGNPLFTYQEDTTNALGNKELNVSSLRRKLFSQGDASPSKEEKNQDDNILCVQINGLASGSSTPKTPKTPKTPNWVTSSPFRIVTPASRSSPCHESMLQSSFLADPLNSPVLSPIQAPKSNGDDDEKTTNHHYGSLDVSSDYSISSLNESDLKDNEIPENECEEVNNNKIPLPIRVNACSIEPCDSLVDVKESTRLSVRDRPNVSPIKHGGDEIMDISIANGAKYSETMNVSELPDFSQSVKESTARNLHGITGLFSPIRSSRGIHGLKNVDDFEENNEENDAYNGFDASFDDGGPLDITELSLPEYNQTGHEVDTNEDEVSDEVFQSPVVIVSPFPTPKRSILKHSTKREEKKEGTGQDRFGNRFEKLENKLSQMENRLENVENVYGKEIQELHKWKAENYHSGKRNTGSVDFQSKNQIKNNVRNETKKTSINNDPANRQPLRNIENKPELYREGLKFEARENKKNQEKHLDITNVVEKADIALTKARKVQRRIDDDFDFCLEAGLKSKHSPNDEDIESTEVTSILENKMQCRNPMMEFRDVNIDSGISTLYENKFKDYRLREYRDSLNDSWDIRSRDLVELGEIDRSILSSTQKDSRAPTPVMNIAGMSICPARKEKKIQYFLNKAISNEKKWQSDLSKIERRHTWPSAKATKVSTGNYIRSISPCFTFRSRAPKSYPFIKQETASKIRDELKNRSISRIEFLSNFS